MADQEKNRESSSEIFIMFITPPTTLHMQWALQQSMHHHPVKKKSVFSVDRNYLERQLMGVFQPPPYDTEALPGTNSFLFTLQALCPQSSQAMLL